MQRSEDQIVEDLKTLSQYLKTEFGQQTHDKIIKIIDKRLSLGGKLAKIIIDQGIGYITKKALGDFNLLLAIPKVTIGILSWLAIESCMSDTPENMNRYMPDTNWNEYCDVVLRSWQRGGFRYIPMAKLYAKPK